MIHSGRYVSSEVVGHLCQCARTLSASAVPWHLSRVVGVGSKLWPFCMVAKFRSSCNSPKVENFLADAIVAFMGRWVYLKIDFKT